ncbi:MAG TPA: hypothetical protein VLE70_00190 [Anaerolineae bacterium]|jgi:hypothetical protein|nr:hypothetical protein [Anaerolineae bacterium]
MAQLLALECSSEEAVRWATETLASADLQVATSFDLRTARAAHTECACPHHGTAACDCQMVVLLVYGRDAGPATLVLHGRDGRTYLSLADTPGQRPSPKLAATIFAALSLDALAHDERAQDLLQIP